MTWRARPSTHAGHAHRAEPLVVDATQDASIAERLLGTVATDVVRHDTRQVLVVWPRRVVRELPVPESDPA